MPGSPTFTGFQDQRLSTRPTLQTYSSELFIIFIVALPKAHVPNDTRTDDKPPTRYSNPALVSLSTFPSAMSVAKTPTMMVIRIPKSHGINGNQPDQGALLNIAPPSVISRMAYYAISTWRSVVDLNHCMPNDMNIA